MALNGFFPSASPRSCRRAGPPVDPPRSRSRPRPRLLGDGPSSRAKQTAGPLRGQTSSGTDLLYSTVDERVQTIYQALENGLPVRETVSGGEGVDPGSVVCCARGWVILLPMQLAEVYKDRHTTTPTTPATAAASARLAWRRRTAALARTEPDTMVPDEPCGAMGPSPVTGSRTTTTSSGPMPLRRRAESAIRCRVDHPEIELTYDKRPKLGIRSPLQPYIATALGAAR